MHSFPQRYHLQNSSSLLNLSSVPLQNVVSNPIKFNPLSLSFQQNGSSHPNIFQFKSSKQLNISDSMILSEQKVSANALRIPDASNYQRIQRSSSSILQQQRNSIQNSPPVFQTQIIQRASNSQQPNPRFNFLPNIIKSHSIQQLPLTRSNSTMVSSASLDFLNQTNSTSPSVHLLQTDIPHYLISYIQNGNSISQDQNKNSSQIITLTSKPSLPCLSDRTLSPVQYYQSQGIPYSPSTQQNQLVQQKQKQIASTSRTLNYDTLKIRSQNEFVSNQSNQNLMQENPMQITSSASSDDYITSQQKLISTKNESRFILKQQQSSFQSDRNLKPNNRQKIEENLNKALNQRYKPSIQSTNTRKQSPLNQNENMWNNKISITRPIEEANKIKRLPLQFSNQFNFENQDHQKGNHLIQEYIEQKPNQQQSQINKEEQRKQSKEQQNLMSDKNDLIQQKNEELQAEIEIQKDKYSSAKSQIQKLENLVQELIFESSQVKKINIENESNLNSNMELFNEQKKLTSQLREENQHLSQTIAQNKLQIQSLSHQNLIFSNKMKEVSLQMKELEWLCQELLNKNKEGEDYNISLSNDLLHYKKNNEKLHQKNEEMKLEQTFKLISIQKNTLELEKIETILTDDNSWKKIYIHNKREKDLNFNSLNASALEEDVHKLLEVRKMLIQELILKTNILKERVILMRKKDLKSSEDEMMNQIMKLQELSESSISEQYEVIHNQFDCKIAQLKAQIQNKEDIILAKYQENKYLLNKIQDIEENRQNGKEKNILQIINENDQQAAYSNIQFQQFEQQQDQIDTTLKKKYNNHQIMTNLSSNFDYSMPGDREKKSNNLNIQEINPPHLTKTDENQNNTGQILSNQKKNPFNSLQNLCINQEQTQHLTYELEKERKLEEQNKKLIQGNSTSVENDRVLHSQTHMKNKQKLKNVGQIKENLFESRQQETNISINNIKQIEKGKGTGDENEKEDVMPELQSSNSSNEDDDNQYSMSFEQNLKSSRQYYTNYLNDEMKLFEGSQIEKEDQINEEGEQFDFNEVKKLEQNSFDEKNKNGKQKI